jgi:WD40 repeat protein
MRRTLAIVAVAVSVMLAALTDVNAASEKRRALVIANAKYLHTEPLKNPDNDAALIAGKLKEVGFEVQFESNVDAKRFSEIINKFSSSLDKESEALFYYAGHGLQFRGENFLVGVDASLKNEAALQFETFRLYTIINLLEQRAGTTLLFWDACRDNPLAKELQSISVSSELPTPEPGRGGAAPVPPRRGDTYIVYSAEENKKAHDGVHFSPFAESLGRHIATEDLEIDKLFQRVTQDVRKLTDQTQSPQRLSQLTRNFYFRPGKAAERDQETDRQLDVNPRPLPIEKKRITIVSLSPQTSRMRGAEATPPPTEAFPDKSPQTSSTEPAPVDPASQNVVIAVDRGASTVVRTLRISPDGMLLALGDDEGRVRIVRLQDFNVIATIDAHSKRISDLDFSSDSRTLLSAGRDGAIRFWDVESRRQVRELKVADSIPYSARMHPNLPDRYVLMGDQSGRLVAWDLKRNKIITNAKFHQGRVLSVAYQPGGRGTFLSSGGDGLVKIRLPEGKRFTLHMHDGPIFRAGYGATGKLVYTASGDRTAKIWEAARLEQQQPRAILKGHLKYVLTADMSRDEKLFATGGGDKALNLWDVQSGRLIGRMKGHTSDIEAVAFSPDGKLIVSASEDKSVRIWSVNNQEELATLFFQKNGERYVGVTFENDTFGDHDSGLISVFVDGRKVSGVEADRFVHYIGRRISITEY